VLGAKNPRKRTVQAHRAINMGAAWRPDLNDSCIRGASLDSMSLFTDGATPVVVVVILLRPIKRISASVTRL